MILLHMLIKAICFALFSFLSVFVFMYGRSKSNIKILYAVTSIFLLGVILFL